MKKMSMSIKMNLSSYLNKTNYIIQECFLKHVNDDIQGHISICDNDMGQLLQNNFFVISLYNVWSYFSVLETSWLHEC